MENNWEVDETVIRPWGPQVTPGGLHRGYDWTAEAKVAERTRKLREERGWSQEELGRKLGTYGFAMHQTTVAKLEGAARPIRLNEVQALANIFGVSPADLFEDAFVQNEHELAVAAREVQRASAALAEAEQTVNRARMEAAVAQDHAARAVSELAERRAAAAAAEARLGAVRRG